MTAERNPSISSRSRIRFGLFFLAIALAFLALVAYQIYASRIATQAAATTNARNLTLVLEAKLNADFMAAERTVSAMVAEIEPNAMRPENASRYRGKVAHWLSDRVRDVPSASALRYFDANGDRLYTSAEGEPPVNIADRPHFQRLRRDLAISVIFSEVTLGRAAGRVSMYVAKPIRDTAGLFLGIATTTIDLTTLHEHFRSIEVGKAGVVTLRRLDNGASVVRFPGPVEVDNKPTPDLPVRHALLKEGRGGAMDIRSRIDGSRRIYGYRQIGTFPLFVAVGIADSDYLAEWHRGTAMLLAGSLLFLAILGAVFFWLAAAESRRDKSETRLRESESRFKHLTELSSDWYWEQDENCRFTFLSVDLDVQKSTVNDVLGKTRWELPNIDSDPEVMREHNAQLAAREPFRRLVIKRMGLDNTIQYMSISGDPVFDDQGQFKGYRGVGTDITERKRLELDLSEREAFYRAISDHGRALIWMAGLDKGCYYFNRPWLEFTGRTLEQEKGHGWAEGVHPEDSEPCMATYAAAFDRRENFGMVYRLRRHDGEYRWIIDEGTPRYDKDGGFVGYVGHCLDITDSKKAEQALQESEARYRRFADALPLGTVITQDGVIKYVNPASVELSGYPEEELLGKPFLSIVCAADRPRLMDLHRRRQNGDEIEPTYVISIIRKDSDVREWQLHTSTIEWNAKPAAYEIITDVTDQRRSEVERTRLEAQLRESQKMEALGTMAGGVAHDFNNALAMIIGNVELARQDVGPGHPALVSLDEIGKASRRAKDLVQQILSFGRRQKLERKATSLALVVVETARLVRATLPAMVSLNINCEPDTPAVMADATQIKQILLNLCGNAIQAIQDQGEAGTIEINLCAYALSASGAHGNLQPGRYARLTVRDSGPGMDEATRSHIFEPFFTTKPVGKGTGLGLAVVHGIVQAHDATIEVESVPGKGSAFRIHFPAIDMPAEDVVQPEAGTRQINGAGKRVLYVDDEEAIIFLMKRLLERQGFRVSGYTDPQEAVAAVRAHPYEFDLAVTDFNMPNMSGLAVASALREIRVDLPVVLASGYITEDLRQKAPAAGVRELIYKPNTVDDLCAAVARCANAQIKVAS